ncbi:MAG: hypothetical protein HOD60_14620 [Candidatus Nitrosopelagicus sp.]|nr:hypothetical protein [Candidatus Nitrosopelagicus sp.]
MSWKEDPITEKQMGMLRYLGLNVNYTNITKGKASELINEISDKNNPLYEKILYIRNLGDLDSHPLDIESCNELIETLELKIISNKIKKLGYRETIPDDILKAKEILHSLQPFGDNPHPKLHEFNQAKSDDYKN